jgi:hypothetical protein
MATRSAIAVKHGDRVKAVYCHWDGYLSNNGRILQEHYSSPKANHLVSLGDVSSLQAEIGEKHAFSRLDTDMPAEEYEALYGNMTTFYGRDRETTGCDFKSFDDVAAFVDYYEGAGCEYFYLHNGTEWLVSTGQMQNGFPVFELLSVALETLKVEG